MASLFSKAPREEAAPPPPPDPKSPEAVTTEPAAAPPPAADEPKKKKTFKEKAAKAKEKAAKKKEELKAKALEAKARALKKTRIKDPFVERIIDGCVIWSQDWKRDLWLFLKTYNAFLSSVFVHPDHPYSPPERRVGLAVTIFFAVGVVFLFEGLAANAQVAALLNLILGAVLNTIFGLFYRYAVECPCVQRGAPACIKSCFEKIGKCTALVMTVIASVFFIVGLLAILSPKRKNQGAGFLFISAAWKFVAAKMEDWFFMSLLTSSLSFFWQRRCQMKPAPTTERTPGTLAYRICGAGKAAPADPKKVAAFFGKVKKRPYCCGCCGAPALPKNFPGRVWLKWIGEDKIFEDLPPRPPSYLVEKGRCYDCCSCFNCCCFCYASCITNFIARRETGDPSVDVDDESTLEAHKYMAVYGEDARDWVADVEAPAPQ